MAGMESVLNPEGVRFVEMVDDLSLGSLETRYTFMDRDIHQDLLVRDMGEGMRVHWTEILQRAHLTAVTAILRSRRWLFGVVQAKADNNLLVFAANLRGLLESAADSSTALKDVPATLACHHFSISESLAGGPKGDFAPRQMEDRLIHYFHGRRLQAAERANAPQSHGVLLVQEYLKIFGDPNETVHQCYRYLCDLTHSGAYSVTMWFDFDDPTGLEYWLSTHQDKALIDDFLQHYATFFQQLIGSAFNVPVVTLNALNYFSVEHLHTPKLLGCNLDSSPVWMECRDELDGKGIQPVASAS